MKIYKFKSNSYVHHLVIATGLSKNYAVVLISDNFNYQPSDTIGVPSLGSFIPYPIELLPKEKLLIALNFCLGRDSYPFKREL